MRSPTERSDLAPLLLTFGLCSLILFLRLVGESAWDLGDGALHYLQVRHAHTYIHIFYDQWAKPLYVLLGTPFAQLGPVGMTLFNVVLAGATALIIMTIVGKRPAFIGWLAPIMLLASIQYFRVVISGLTEPLFGLLTVLCVLWLLRGRTTAAMVLLSLAPYTRPEYLAFAPFAIAWVLYQRQWRALPWLLVGPALYYSSGWLLLHESLWYFAQDPYLGGKDYGEGPWNHFLLKAPSILGEPLLWAACLAVPLLIFLCIRDRERRERHMAIVILALLPVLSIWAVHSYAYWAGGHASSGLIRVLSTAAPLTVLFTAYTFTALARKVEGRRALLLGAVVVVGYGLWAQDDLRFRVPLPAPVGNEQRQVDLAVMDARQHFDPDRKILFMHPYFAVAMGLNIWDTAHVGGFLERDWSHPGAGLREGDLLQWDPSYGPVESQFELRRLIEDTAFNLLSVHMGGYSWGWDPFAVWLFERRDVRRQWVTDTLVDLELRRGAGHLDLRADTGNAFDSTAFLLSSQEFPVNVHDMAACSEACPFTDWVVQWRIKPKGADTSGFHWVFAEQLGDSHLQYHETEVGMGPGEQHFPNGRELPGTERRLYLWNEKHQPFALRQLRVLRRCLQQRPDPRRVGP